METDWTDIVGRNIHIVGTANSGQKQCFTKLEANDEANKFPPLYIGYYQDKHYQSLEWVGPDPKQIVGAIIEELLSEVVSKASLRVPKKRCRILPIVPFHRRKKTVAEIAKRSWKVLSKSMDSMFKTLYFFNY